MGSLVATRMWYVTLKLTVPKPHHTDTVYINTTPERKSTLQVRLLCSHPWIISISGVQYLEPLGVFIWNQTWGDPSQNAVHELLKEHFVFSYVASASPEIMEGFCKIVLHNYPPPMWSITDHSDADINFHVWNSDLLGLFQCPHSE